MARTRSRRARTSSGALGDQIPDILSVGRQLLRPEVIGTALVVAAAAVLQFLLPLADLVTGARDGLVAALGVHVFTVTVVAAALGLALALRHTEWARTQRRHLFGTVLLLVWSAGVLGLWYPATSLGGADLAMHSAGGDLGRALTSTPIAVTLWLVTLPLGFALLWPLTARELAGRAPGGLASAGHWSGLGSLRSARTGLRRDGCAEPARRCARACSGGESPLRATR